MEGSGQEVVGEDYSYKEHLRDLGRQRLAQFRKQRQVAAATASGSTPVQAAGVPRQHIPEEVELTTFKVVSSPLVQATPSRNIPAHPDCTELQELGASAPGARGWDADSSAAASLLNASSVTATTGVGHSYPPSLASTLTGQLQEEAPASPAPNALGNPLPSLHIDRTASASPARPGEPPAHDHDLARIASSHIGDIMSPSGGRGGGTGGDRDQALVDMLLAQVQALTHDRAALQSEVARLRRENEQLHELVGYLTLEAEEHAEQAATGQHQHHQEGGEDYSGEEDYDEGPEPTFDVPLPAEHLDSGWAGSGSDLLGGGLELAAAACVVPDSDSDIDLQPDLAVHR